MKVTIGTVTLLFAVHASTVSATEKEEWLAEHNTRRLKYHTTLNKKPVVNLKWSSGLAALAKTWAEGNVAVCENRSGSDGGYGRSAVMRKGTTTGLTPAWTLTNWENKKSQGYPANGAFTQAVWRPTKYVGCYIATSTGASECQSAVCYYAKPGNCAMGETQGTSSAAITEWRKKVYADDSFCTPDCPPEGCTASGVTKSPTKKPTKRPTKKPAA